MEDKSIPIIRFGKIKWDQQNFFKGLRQALFEIGDLKAGSAIKIILESVEPANKLGEKAFQLIFTSLLAACRDLIKANHPDKLNSISSLAVKTDEFRRRTMELMEEMELKADFFENPTKHPLIRQVQPIYKSFLQEQIGLLAEESVVLTKALPTRFWRYLRREWNQYEEEYQPLYDYFRSNPFDMGWYSHQEKLNYYNTIRSYFQLPSMGDDQLKRSDIYIEPYFEVYKRCLPEEERDYFKQNDNFFQVFENKTLHDYVNNFFLKRNQVFLSNTESAQVLLLLGQPGQGKTSFCYRLIHDQLEEGEPEKDLVFLKLRDLPNVKEFINHPFQAIEAYFKEYFDTFSFDFKNTLIVLDGFDELYMSAGLTDNEVNDFFHRLPLLLLQRPNMLLIITSRLNYIALEKIRYDDVLVLSIAPLTLDQQKRWLKVYSQAHPDCSLSMDKLEIINSESKTHSLDHIRELINQPILLHLIAEAKFDIMEGKNRAEIYTRLFDRLTDLDWDSKLKNFHRITNKENFRDYIRFLAYKIHCSDNEFLLLSEVKSMKETEDFVSENLNSEYENLKDALKDVLITFYLKGTDAQKLEQPRDSAIEFLHESLREYLTGEYLYESLKNVFLSTSLKGKYQVDTWEGALQKVQQLFVDYPLTEYILDYLRGVIENDPDEQAKDKLLSRLEKFFPFILQKGFLFNYLATESSNSPTQDSLNGFHSYWHILKALDRGKKFVKNAYLKPEDAYLKPKFEQLIMTEGVYNSRSLVLDGLNFEEVNFQGARLDRASLNGVRLKDARFDGARLDRATLNKASLIRAKLDRANLYKAKLNGVKLNGASLYGASLDETILYETSLDGAYLERANFYRATLIKTRLVGVSLAGARFDRAKLIYVNFSNAKGLTFEQLSKVETLYQCANLPKNIKKELEAKKPELFEKPSKYSNDALDINTSQLDV